MLLSFGCYSRRKWVGIFIFIYFTAWVTVGRPLHLMCHCFLLSHPRCLDLKPLSLFVLHPTQHRLATDILNCLRARMYFGQSSVVVMAVALKQKWCTEMTHILWHETHNMTHGQGHGLIRELNYITHRNRVETLGLKFLGGTESEIEDSGHAERWWY